MFPHSKFDLVWNIYGSTFDKLNLIVFVDVNINSGLRHYPKKRMCLGKI